MWLSPLGYQTWECGGCGAYALAAVLTTCPHCGKERDHAESASGGGAEQRVAPTRARARTRTGTRAGTASAARSEEEARTEDSERRR